MSHESLDGLLRRY